LNYTGYVVRWNEEKNAQLKAGRGVSFEDIVQCPIATVRQHPSRPNQLIFFFINDDYIWSVPCVIGENEVFLKTLFRSRKHTRMWLKGELS
jgi:hypothetical protein